MKRGKLIMCLVIFLFPILLLFWGFYLLGDHAARIDYTYEVSHDFPSYPRIRVWLQSDRLQLRV